MNSSLVQMMVVIALISIAALYWGMRIFRSYLAGPCARYLLARGHVSLAFRLRRWDRSHSCHD